MRQLPLATALLFSLASMAQAESLSTAELANLVAEPDIAEKVATVLVADEQLYTPSCKQLGSITPDHMSVFEDPRIGQEGKPVAGHWMVRYKVDVCGTDRLRGVLFRIVDENLEISPLLPGNTQTDPQLQNDVSKAFKMATSRAYPTCKTPFVADTRLLSIPKNGDAPWEELWVADVCGRLFGQAIRFVPQEGGTAFAMDIATGDKPAAK
ncbi:MAG: hypothetical protein WAX89_04950 [Alphaproteobacteria bacterium]